MQSGAAGPAWLAVLLFAIDLGQTPWEIAGGAPLIWFFRWQAYKHHLAKAQESRRAY